MSCQGNDLTDKLRGKWQLKTIEQAGDIIQVDTVWYNFQTESLFMYQIYWADKDSFMYRYGYRVQTDDIMELELDDNNKEVPLTRFLPYTDWESATRTFIVENITGKHLKIRSDNKSYSFTKFE
ncbi:MAG: lipocalin-like domain-containing protein [Tannerella sp.]|nr:lipocalin-like domain-containing protein [Tannerella sp.]